MLCNLPLPCFCCEFRFGITYSPVYDICGLYSTSLFADKNSVDQAIHSLDAEVAQAILSLHLDAIIVLFALQHWGLLPFVGCFVCCKTYSQLRDYCLVGQETTDTFLKVGQE